jgi:hypothetical protein
LKSIKKKDFLRYDRKKRKEKGLFKAFLKSIKKKAFLRHFWKSD